MGNASKHRCAFSTIGSQPLHHGIETLGEALDLRSSTGSDGIRILTITHANWDDDDPDDIRGQLDRLVDKGDMTRAAADDYLTHYRED